MTKAIALLLLVFAMNVFADSSDVNSPAGRKIMEQSEAGQDQWKLATYKMVILCDSPDEVARRYATLGDPSTLSTEGLPSGHHNGDVCLIVKPALVPTTP